jgi:serine/threonine protein kinase
MAGWSMQVGAVFHVSDDGDNVHVSREDLRFTVQLLCDHSKENSPSFDWCLQFLLLAEIPVLRILDLRKFIVGEVTFDGTVAKGLDKEIVRRAGAMSSASDPQMLGSILCNFYGIATQVPQKEAIFSLCSIGLDVAVELDCCSYSGDLAQSLRLAGRKAPSSPNLPLVRCSLLSKSLLGSDLNSFMLTTLRVCHAGEEHVFRVHHSFVEHVFMNPQTKRGSHWLLIDRQEHDGSVKFIISEQSMFGVFLLVMDLTLDSLDGSHEMRAPFLRTLEPSVEATGFFSSSEGVLRHRMQSVVAVLDIPAFSALLGMRDLSEFHKALPPWLQELMNDDAEVSVDDMDSVVQLPERLDVASGEMEKFAAFSAPLSKLILSKCKCEIDLLLAKAESISAWGGGILKHIDWDTFALAGGGALHLLRTHDDINSFNGDFDLFPIVSLESPSLSVSDYCTKVYESLREATKHVEDILVIRTDSTVTFLVAGHRVQLILRKSRNVAEVLNNFDLDCVGVAFYKSSFFVTHRFLRCVGLGYVNVFDPSFCAPQYRARLQKYLKRGFSLFVPGLDAESLLPGSNMWKVVNYDTSDESVDVCNNYDEGCADAVKAYKNDLFEVEMGLVRQQIAMMRPQLHSKSAILKCPLRFYRIPYACSARDLFLCKYDDRTEYFSPEFTGCSEGEVPTREQVLQFIHKNKKLFRFELPGCEGNDIGNETVAQMGPFADSVLALLDFKRKTVSEVSYAGRIILQSTRVKFPASEDLLGNRGRYHRVAVREDWFLEACLSPLSSATELFDSPLVYKVPCASISSTHRFGQSVLDGLKVLEAVLTWDGWLSDISDSGGLSKEDIDRVLTLGKRYDEAKSAVLRAAVLCAQVAKERKVDIDHSCGDVVFDLSGEIRERAKARKTYVDAMQNFCKRSEKLLEPCPLFVKVTDAMNLELRRCPKLAQIVLSNCFCGAEMLLSGKGFVPPTLAVGTEKSGLSAKFKMYLTESAVSVSDQSNISCQTVISHAQKRRERKQHGSGAQSRRTQLAKNIYEIVRDIQTCLKCLLASWNDLQLARVKASSSVFDDGFIFDFFELEDEIRQAEVQQKRACLYYHAAIDSAASPLEKELVLSSYHLWQKHSDLARISEIRDAGLRENLMSFEAELHKAMEEEEMENELGTLLEMSAKLEELTHPLEEKEVVLKWNQERGRLKNTTELKELTAALEIRRQEVQTLKQKLLRISFSLPEVLVFVPKLNPLGGNDGVAKLLQFRRTSLYYKHVSIMSDTENRRVLLVEVAETAEKVVLKEFPLTSEDPIPLVRSASILTRLRHPGIVRLLSIVYDASNSAKSDCCQWFLEFPYYPGGNLRDWIGRGKVKERLLEAKKIMRRLLLTVAYLHGHGIAHRDLKPENIFFNEANEPIIGDFDGSKADVGSGITMIVSHQTKLTVSPGYAPLEVLLGRQGAIDGYAVDMFSFGIICHEMLTGRIPTYFGMVCQIDDKELPETISPWVRKMLSEYPASRPRSTDLLFFSPFFSGEEAEEKRARGDDNKPALASVQRSLSRSWTELVKDDGQPIEVTVMRRRVEQSGLHEIESKDIIAALAAFDDEDWTTKMRVTFVGEIGVDEGGLTKEFFGEAARSLVKSLFAFGQEDGGAVVLPQPEAVEAEMELFGKLVGRAVMQGLLLPETANICQSFWRFMVGAEPTMSDYADFAGTGDYLILQNLRTLSNQQLADLGYTEEVSGVTVTRESCEAYLKQRVREKMVHGREKALSAFLSGLSFFEDVKEVLNFISSFDLKRLVSGGGQLSSKWILDAMLFVGFNARSRIKLLFSEMLTSWEQSRPEMLSDFLSFITSSRALPIDARNFIKVQCIARQGDKKNYPLPSSHTCFNTVDVPDYDDAALLENKFLAAMQQGGFHTI